VKQWKGRRDHATGKCVTDLPIALDKLL